MGKKSEPSERLTTQYLVHSKNTGAQVCGPYENRADASRECDRLNREAIRGRTEPTDEFPQGQELSRPGDPQLMHAGKRQEYEVRSREGVIL